MGKKNNCPEALKEAVRQYYEWHGDKRAHALQILHNQSDDELVMVHFVDDFGRKMTSLMYFQGWKDGHYEVSEYDAFIRSREDIWIEDFKQSNWGPVEDDDGEEDYMAPYDLSGDEQDAYEHEQEVIWHRETYDGGYDDDDYEGGMIL